MIIAGHEKPGRSLVCAAYVLTICFAGAACALTNRTWSSVAHPAPRGAQIIAGSWDRAQHLQLGSPVVVTLKSGARLKGLFHRLGEGALVLTDPAGKPLTIARPEISRIVTHVDDRLTNGALMGAGIGLATAVAILAAAGSGDGYLLPSAKWAAPSLLSGVGIVAGILVDRAHKSEELIYVTP